MVVPAIKAGAAINTVVTIKTKIANPRRLNPFPASNR